MKRTAALLCLLLTLLVAPERFVPVALAQTSGGEIVVAQNGPGSFFRRLFGGNRRQQQAPQRGPFQLFPDFETLPPPVEAPRQRKPRVADAQPKEPAPVQKADNAKRALVFGDFMANALAKGLTDAYRDNANAVVIDAS